MVTNHLLTGMILQVFPLFHHHEVLTFDGHRDVAKIIDFGLGAIRRMEDVEEEWLSEARLGACEKTGG